MFARGDEGSASACVAVVGRDKELRCVLNSLTCSLKGYFHHFCPPPKLRLV